MNPDFNFDAEGVFDETQRPHRPRRKRKEHWRKQWLVMSEGSTLTNRAIKQLMRAPKLLSNAMPRVMPDVEKLREAGVTVGQFSNLKWEKPHSREGVDAEFGLDRAVEKHEREEAARRRVTLKGDRKSPYPSLRKRKSFIAPTPGLS